MTRDHIAALFARRQQAWDRLDAAALAADYTDDASVESPLAGGSAAGRDAIEKLYATYFAAFPDFKVEQELLLIDAPLAAAKKCIERHVGRLAANIPQRHVDAGQG